MKPKTAILLLIMVFVILFLSFLYIINKKETVPQKIEAVRTLSEEEKETKSLEERRQIILKKLNNKEKPYKGISAEELEQRRQAALEKLNN